jgi:hypothetical protein
MSTGLRRVFVAALVVAGAVTPALARKNDPFSKSIPKRDRVEHALSRLTFGARPGDEEKVTRLGLKKWIDLQLHPGRIPENPILESKLNNAATLRMSAADLAASFPDKPAVVKADANAPAIQDFLTPVQLRALRTGPPAQAVETFAGLSPDQQHAFLRALPGVRQRLFDAASPELRRRIVLTSGPRQVISQDLLEGKMLRAIYSERQLEEVLTDFWFNHFNVFLDKGPVHFYTASYERDVIRPHALGSFRDLLEATAKSPAMLFYLDNWQSVGPNRGQRPGPAARRGLNENYGRELLELHTLGVDGGYTQRDVTEVARCFTGWTIAQPNQGGAFTFNPRQHDDGEKTVLGVIIPAGGGEEDGEKVLDIVASHPSTARHISRELAQRFVADDPPASLVERMAQTFLKTKGDLREVIKTMLASKEFWSAGAYRSKVKSPLEYVASAVRAEGADVDYAFFLANQVGQMGEPLYRKLEPTGYKESGAEWVASSSLLARMNFALQLAGGRAPGVKIATPPASAEVLGSPEFQRR